MKRQFPEYVTNILRNMPKDNKNDADRPDMSKPIVRMQSSVKSLRGHERLMIGAPDSVAEALSVVRGVFLRSLFYELGNLDENVYNEYNESD